MNNKELNNRRLAALGGMNPYDNVFKEKETQNEINEAIEIASSKIQKRIAEKILSYPYPGIPRSEKHRLIEWLGLLDSEEKNE